MKRETGWEKFNRLWDEHGHRQAKAWARGKNGSVAGESWIERKESDLRRSSDS